MQYNNFETENHFIMSIFIYKYLICVYNYRCYGKECSCFVAFSSEGSDRIR